jgi:thiol-disulfide isomerase/thioredoxin
MNKNINLNTCIIMKTKLLIFALLLLTSGILMGQTTPEPASKILDAACKQAAAGKKNVMIVFHASWCGWCKKFEASVNDSTCKDFFDRNFVIKYLTILENGDKKSLENPGANELFESNGGKGEGIPYFLIYDKSGKLLANSKLKPDDAKASNIGCPASKEEVAFFIDILKKTSNITEKETVAITARFRQNEGKAH